MPEVSLGPSPLHAQVSAEVFELFAFLTHHSRRTLVSQQSLGNGELEQQSGPAAGQTRRDEFAEVLRSRALVQQALAHEFHDLAKFFTGQCNRCAQQRVEARQNWLNWSA